MTTEDTSTRQNAFVREFIDWAECHAPFFAYHTDHNELLSKDEGWISLVEMAKEALDAGSERADDVGASIDHLLPSLTASIEEVSEVRNELMTLAFLQEDEDHAARHEADLQNWAEGLGDRLHRAMPGLTAVTRWFKRHPTPVSRYGAPGGPEHG